MMMTQEEIDAIKFPEDARLLLLAAALKRLYDAVPTHIMLPGGELAEAMLDAQEQLSRYYHGESE